MALGAKQRQPFSDFISQCQVLEMSFPAIPPQPSVRNTKQPSDLLCTFFQSPELFVQGTCLVGASESQKQNKSPRRSHSLGQLQMRSPGRTGSGTNAPSHFLPPFIYKQPSYWLLPCNNLALCTGVNHTSPKVCFNSSFK